MRINVLGAGPAGLFFAILMKRSDPRHEIAVWERNAPDATFGWGVVFSEGSLDELEDADYESYVALTEAFARWNPLDVRFGGTTTRVRGNVFSGVGRKELLQILQARARELGVQMTFEHEVGVDSILDADLVLAADGANSTARRRFETEFQPSITPHPAKYAWYGADFAFPVFTYIFQETEWGLFQAHCYPYSDRRSTMVVLISEPTWHAAGLDDMSEEESRAFTEAVFAPHLAGHRLLSNRSLWISFPWISCRHWHFDNVVLAGDAAHTAHFSIGAGTKLALEDSIALARALWKHRGAVPPALTEYEMQRQPAVERMQEASRISAAYFGSLERYLGFEPIQFTYQLMTRTPRITHNNLAARDPEFVRSVDTWFWSRATERAGDGLLAAPPPGFAPLRLRSLTVANRVAVVPVAGETPPAGAGLTIKPLVAVSDRGRISPDQPLAAGLPPAGEGSTVMPSLCHAGRRGSTRSRAGGLDRPLPAGEGWPVVSASPIPYAPWMPAPAELTRQAMEAVVEEFVAAAQQVARLGYRALELDMSRGYLLASFLSPLSNRRQDGYGGPIENRLRFPLAVLDAVRAEWPADLPLGVAYSATDFAPGGISPRDSLAAARAFGEHGADVVRVLTGQTVYDTRPEYGRVYGAAYSDRVRNECGVRTIAFGQITTLDEVNTLIAAGRADLCVLDVP